MQGNCIHPAESGSSEAKVAKEPDVNECFGYSVRKSRPVSSARR